MIKKLILLFLFISSFISAQEIVKTGNLDLKIPKDYYELKNAYIIMANLYNESNIALTKSTKNFKNLKIEYDKVTQLLKDSEIQNKQLINIINNELNPNTIKLENTINDLTNELNKAVKPDLFQFYLGVSFSNELIPNIHIGGFINLIIYEQYFIKLEYLFLDQYSIGVGYRF